jgi:gp16 family phage-associated protein
VTDETAPVQTSLAARFHAALKLAGLTVEEWADKNNYSDGHVYAVLSGKRESPPLVEKFEGFIAQHLPLQPASAA